MRMIREDPYNPKSQTLGVDGEWKGCTTGWYSHFVINGERSICGVKAPFKANLQLHPRCDNCKRILENLADNNYHGEVRE